MKVTGFVSGFKEVEGKPNDEGKVRVFRNLDIEGFRLGLNDGLPAPDVGKEVSAVVTVGWSKDKRPFFRCAGWSYLNGA
jgi:hypothetical protein